MRQSAPSHVTRWSTDTVLSLTDLQGLPQAEALLGRWTHSPRVLLWLQLGIGREPPWDKPCSVAWTWIFSGKEPHGIPKIIKAKKGIITRICVISLSFKITWTLLCPCYIKNGNVEVYLRDDPVSACGRGDFEHTLCPGWDVTATIIGITFKHQLTLALFAGLKSTKSHAVRQAVQHLYANNKRIATITTSGQIYRKRPRVGWNTFKYTSWCLCVKKPHVIHTIISKSCHQI